MEVLGTCIGGLMFGGHDSTEDVCWEVIRGTGHYMYEEAKGWVVTVGGI